MKTTHFKRGLSLFMSVLMILSCWVWVTPEQSIASAADVTSSVKDHYLFAYFTGTSKEGQTIHLAVSEDGYQYTALRNNQPVIIPSKGVGNVRDPYIWYNEQDNYYYILATDLDFTDGGSDYSNNSQSFMIWRSKDLVNWYDETFIDVSAMAHLIGDTRGMTAVWAPQVLWDGSAYVVYFTLCCNATGADGTGWNNMQLVYLKTTDLLSKDAYYEYGVLFDPNYHVIDADIIQNPSDGLYYLFYKNEDWDYDSPTTDLKTIHYLVSENACGPYSTTNPSTGASIDTNGDGRGYRVYPNVTVSLEGCNSYFDNDGNLITYTDEYGYTNSVGESEAHFHISKSSDFKTFTMLDDSIHNINSLSPRHGSVVKITEEEYTRLLNNSYTVSSSSFPDTETLEDHLVARYFTTSNAAENTVVGQPDLATVVDIEMAQDVTGEYYAIFNGTSSYAETSFSDLFINGLNYEDGFTITFSALNFPMSSENSENNDRIYEIANIFGDQSSSDAYYTCFSPSGGGTGSYLQNYNGPVLAGSYDWLADKDGSNRDDGCIHEYIISYATGNVMVYVDGELVISRNRFTGSATLDDSWYQALGSLATMRIGKSGWDVDPLFEGYMQDLCIYDCSMSYYDAKSLDDSLNADLGWVGERTYTGITSAVPTFTNATASQMESLRGTNFSNILYTSGVTGTPSGSGSDANPTADSAAAYSQGNDTKVAVYYPETTVLIVDGINPALMPIMMAGRVNAANKNRYIYNTYPTNSYGSNQDNTELHFNVNWVGWNSSAAYHETIQNPDGSDQQIGYKSGASGKAAKLAKGRTQDSRKIYYYANTLQVDENNIDFGGSYYKKFNLSWQWYGGSSTTYTESDTVQGHMYSDNDIYVINYKPLLDLRESITEADYNEVMNNTELCPALREKYASAVYEIRTLYPTNFGFDEAPETATKACAKAISEAIGTYEGVMAEIARQKESGTYGHSIVECEAREATCCTNGLTSGQYCTICGEVIEEQELIAPLAHTFGDIYTEDGVQYRKCSVCGVVIEYQASEVRYENLFSLNRWYETTSNSLFFGSTSGTLTTNLVAGTITFKNTQGHYNFTNVSFSAEKDFSKYSIPVTGNKTYVAEFTYTCDQPMALYALVFDKDGNNLCSSLLLGSISREAGTGTVIGEFELPANSAYFEFGFYSDYDCTMTVSQIGVYEKEDYDKFGATTADARLGYYPGDSKELCFPNPADGYVFDGWYTSTGIRIDNVNQLSNPSVIVYGKWIKAGYNVVYDSIFSFSSWAKSSCNQLWYGDEKDADGNVTRLVSKEGILTDAENGTITITNDEDTTYFARTNYWVDTQNLYVMTVEQNTDYIIEYTASSDDGAKPSICAYITGGTASYPESGGQTKYSLGTQYFAINTGDNTKLALRFDNVQHGTTVTFSDIAVYKADFLEAATTIENRQYRRYYPQEMGIGDVFEYMPERIGYTFDTWMADTDNDGIGDEDWANKDDAFIVNQNWHLFSTWTENSYNIAYNANGGSGSVETQSTLYTADVTLASSGFTKAGYTLAGWSPVSNATVATYALGATTSRLCGDPNGTVTLYAVWTPNNYNVTFDNFIDFSAWNKSLSSSKGTVSDITDTGFTITSLDGVSEATLSSPFFAVEEGKKYRIDIDIEGDGWNVYIFFHNETSTGTGLEFKDNTNRYSDNGGVSEPVFTAPTGATKAQIRVDCNGNKQSDGTYLSNTVRFDNIRVYEDTGITVSPVNKYVTYTDTFGTLPTPVKNGYDFVGWYTADGTLIESSTVVTQTETVNLYSKWVLNNDSLTADDIVVDYGMPVTFAPLANDEIFLNEASSSSASYKLLGVSTDGITYSSSLDGSYGTFSVSGYNVTYTPTTELNGCDVVYYHASISINSVVTEVVSTISIIPASVVYYEDDYSNMITYTDGGSADKSTGTWSTAGESKLASATQTLASDVYGYDAVYDVASTYSMGSAHVVSVSQKNNPKSKYSGSEGNSWPVAQFTFAGTGFDVVSLISSTTGAVEVKVFAGTDTTVKAKYDWIVDTYYGYTYNSDGEWVVTTNANTLYQIPVIGRTDLAYGTYTVQIIPTYTTRLDHQSKGAYDFYLDAIRVYDPTGACADANNNPYVAGVYAADGEYTVYEAAVRDVLVNASDLDVTNDDETAGIVFINSSIPKGTFEDYTSKGPKNEVYLSNGQCIAFNITVDKKPTKVLISAHAPNGSSASMRFANTKGDYSEAIAVKSATTLYYKIPSSLISWTENTDGTYTTAKPIIINNNGDSLLAVCNIKCTSDTVATTAVTFSLRRSVLADVADVADTVSNLTSDDPALFVADSVEVETDADEIVIAGSEVNVTVTTSSDVAALTVNGEAATLVSENEDGTKTWNFVYETSNVSGTETITLVAYNSDGYASEATELTVEVESAFEHFFNQLVSFIKAVIEIVKKVYSVIG